MNETKIVEERDGTQGFRCQIKQQLWFDTFDRSRKGTTSYVFESETWEASRR
jgi:hypothetical protein